MKYFSAQYIFTNNGPPLKRGIISASEDGTIISVEDTAGELTERCSIPFYNGIIVPGFVNCHCHLELSHLLGEIPQGTGLGGFLTTLNSKRILIKTDPYSAMAVSDKRMSDEGIVLCADICNSNLSFSIKKRSRIRYINLLEVYGIDSSGANKRMAEILKVAESADEDMLEWYLVPHSVYSVSLPLFRLLRERTGSNRVTSVHFMESEDETELLSGHSGELMDAYKLILSPEATIKTASDHETAVIDEITSSGNLILVHNTAIKREQIAKLKKRDNLFYCLCPGSNRFIENSIPPVNLLKDEKCLIVTGTDSLSSNNQLSILNELKILQEEFPDISLEELIKWSTINGAMALGADNMAGSIEPGKKPGLVLIRDTDLVSMKLLASSSSVRIL